MSFNLSGFPIHALTGFLKISVVSGAVETYVADPYVTDYPNLSPSNLVELVNRLYRRTLESYNVRDIIIGLFNKIVPSIVHDINTTPYHRSVQLEYRSPLVPLQSSGPGKPGKPRKPRKPKGGKPGKNGIHTQASDIVNQEKGTNRSRRSSKKLILGDLAFQKGSLVGTTVVDKMIEHFGLKDVPGYDKNYKILSKTFVSNTVSETSLRKFANDMKLDRAAVIA
jgi:hypothetical protein